MTPPTALLLSAMISSTAGSCTTIADCNWAGDCVGGTCSCAVGFCGAACKKLAMASFRPGAGGLLVANGVCFCIAWMCVVVVWCVCMRGALCRGEGGDIA